MIIVHHLENSRSQRVLWLLEELGLPYEVKRYARDRKTLLAPPALKQVHALGKSPVITDTGAEGTITVAESGAIIEYLLDTCASSQDNARLRPAPGTPERRQFNYWLHFAEGSAMPYLVMKLVFDQVRNAPVPFFIKPIVKGIADKVTQSFLMPNITQQLTFIESTLAQQSWFAGPEFTAADVQMSYPLEAAAERVGLSSSHPHVVAWMKRIHERPAYQRALAQGGPYKAVPG